MYRVAWLGRNGIRHKAFRVANKVGVRAGGEYGFMSTALDQAVALSYAKGQENEPSTVLSIQMGEQNRGAFISSISYYPKEREVLFTPLTRMEVHGEPRQKFWISKPIICFDMMAAVWSERALKTYHA